MMEEVIGEVIVGPDEVLRVTIEGSRRQRVAVRVWFKPRMGGTPRPSKEGLTIPVHKAEAFASCLMKAKGDVR